ncbi:kinesin-like protein KIN-7A [Selaginella moellendorffii]|uniref:kinesin-like protein KIN-7A n=1 Tax=Selaginella moellendorffii TaxID=88036 RepID=UPI000D1CA873|nr:kinesin-like protein KIN-7A [Selaginella moellendorffii]|eukprot:XP_024521728.1 kinesin-like protein KIN-7A [Selaginella moellendorffii]
MAALAAAMVAMGEKNALTPRSGEKAGGIGILSTPGKCRSKEEKIFVTVRVRPMSSREIAQRDTADWECPDDHTVSYKQQPDRSPYPARYSFDRVFGPESSTKVVYEEGAKDVALSALSGINSTIFAYGQTSSGKTFTMRGVIENAIVDIYDAIEKNHQREYILKIAGLEIYNEVVRDLLNPDTGALRLLDDPERGTIVEKLTDTIVRDCKHLRQVLSICEAQRQVGETMLNDASSRSHQIIRLTVESIPRENGNGNGTVNSMVATLNFVDLAGSERASQTLSDGTRLKEGCHINRSLLTLSTVIRKLSGSNRTKSGHIPYRDSKLTRILQLSLGGNARTAIICTMSPARAHVEQSRNTLAFATRAKEVTNNAHVNLVVSDKDLVKQLQKEVARLEAELRIPEAALSSDALLHQKEQQIQKMESEMKELIRQRDAAKTQLNEVLAKMGDEQRDPKELCTPTKKQLLVDELGCPSKAPFMLIQEIRKLEKLQDELGEDASRALEALQKEVECLRLAQVDMNQDAVQTITKLQEEIKNLHVQHRKDENEIEVQTSVSTDVSSPKLKTPTRRRKLLPSTMGSTTSSSRQLFANSPPCSPKTTRSALQENNENNPPRSSENTPPSGGHRRSNSVDIRKMQNMFKTAAEDNIKSIRAYVTELKERVAKLQYQKQLLVCQVLELESNNTGGENEYGEMTPSLHSPSGWRLQFEKQRMQIIELWDVCQVSIIHRTQFYLLFRGDPADAMYMEVEFRRLLWLQEQFAKNDQNQGPGVIDEDNISSYAASVKALRREREMLAKRMRRMPPEMKDELLVKWEIPLESKQRKLQLIEKLWTDARDMQHIQDSAEVVAMIVGFWEPGSASKEMFALNFAPPSSQKPFHFGWNSISTMLNL